MKALEDAFALADALLRKHGRWQVAGVETLMAWPKVSQLVRFEGMSFVMRPGLPKTGPAPSESGTLPAILLKADDYDLDDASARRAIFRFASALAWHLDNRIELVTWAGGGLPIQVGVIRGGSAPAEIFDPPQFKEAPSDKARAALAFYREGAALDNPFYAFLSFYKAFSVAVPLSQRHAWIQKHLGDLGRYGAKAPRDELQKAGTDVSTYLYEECRHAIAHADREPFVDPDSTDDAYCLRKDLPLMRELARIAVEGELGVQSDSTVYRDHLYELKDFGVACRRR